MSAPTTNGTTAPLAVSPVEYVRGLTPEEQEDVFLFLVKELIRVNGGNGLIPVGSETEELGYYVPPAAADERFRLYGPKFSAEKWAEIDARMERAEQEEGIPVEQVLAELKAEAQRIEAERRQTQSP